MIPAMPLPQRNRERARIAIAWNRLSSFQPQVPKEPQQEQNGQPHRHSEIDLRPGKMHRIRLRRRSAYSRARKTPTADCAVIPVEAAADKA